MCDGEARRSAAFLSGLSQLWVKSPRYRAAALLSASPRISRPHQHGLNATLCAKSGCEQSQQGSPLFDHLVGAQQNRCRQLELKRLCGLEVEDGLENRDLLDRQLSWLRSSENFCDMVASSAKGLYDIYSVRHQPA